MAKKTKPTKEIEQGKPASPESLLALAALLKKYASAFENVANDLKNARKTEVIVRGRDGGIKASAWLGRLTH